MEILTFDGGPLGNNTGNSNESRDVQMLRIEDGGNGETIRMEGEAEILELDADIDADDDEDHVLARSAFEQLREEAASREAMPLSPGQQRQVQVESQTLEQRAAEIERRMSLQQQQSGDDDAPKQIFLDVASAQEQMLLHQQQIQQQQMQQQQLDQQQQLQQLQIQQQQLTQQLLEAQQNHQKAAAEAAAVAAAAAIAAAKEKGSADAGTSDTPTSDRATSAIGTDAIGTDPISFDDKAVSAHLLEPAAGQPEPRRRPLRFSLAVAAARAAAGEAKAKAELEAAKAAAAKNDAIQAAAAEAAAAQARAAEMAATEVAAVEAKAIEEAAMQAAAAEGLPPEAIALKAAAAKAAAAEALAYAKAEGFDDYPSSVAGHTDYASQLSETATVSEEKNVQTDLSTLSKANRRSQTTFHLDDSDSDDDPSLANQSLSQSMMRAAKHLGYSKSFQVHSSLQVPGRQCIHSILLHLLQEPGFLNVAMHHLIKENGPENLPPRPNGDNSGIHAGGDINQIPPGAEATEADDSTLHNLY